MIGLGIDTGGTCTDAVLYDISTQKILSVSKTQTTKERLETGIEKAFSMLDPQQLKEASFLALSTTLATNACVENRGCKVKLLFIGVDREIVENSYQNYGFDSIEDLLFIDGIPEDGYMEPVDPDWEKLEALMPEFEEVQAIGIVQLFPSWNNGKYEQKAKELIEQHYNIPIVCGSELFSDLNAIRRGAGTYLNSRLIPIIQEFLGAVKTCMNNYSLDVPIFIVRSDGTLMNEEYARKHPVETLLCGPAASILGGAWMADSQNAVIIDMGGTTTDIGALLKGHPLHVADGIRINHWKTFVKGMAIDTFGLGGDTAVRFYDGKIRLETFRVIPISYMASNDPKLTARIRELPFTGVMKSCPYEGFVWMRDPERFDTYSEMEQRTLTLLKENGPMFATEFEPYFEYLYLLTEKIEKLEQEGLIMRFGITPTDIMHIKGDYTQFNVDAAKEAVLLLSKASQIDLKKIPDEVYTAVKKRMYSNIIRILKEKFSHDEKDCIDPSVMQLIEDSYQADETDFVQTCFQTDLTLVGVGGPIHIFLPDVAKALKTECRVFENSKVANALGTLVGRILVNFFLDIEYREEGYKAYIDEEEDVFEEYEEAEEKTIEFLKKQAKKEARKRGAVGEITFEMEIHKIDAPIGYTDNSMLFGSTVSISAYGNII